jgi:hypothetical protein
MPWMRSGGSVVLMLAKMDKTPSAVAALRVCTGIQVNTQDLVQHINLYTTPYILVSRHMAHIS